MLAAVRTDDFPKKLDQLLDQIVIRVIDFPVLADISWNRIDEYISPCEAFQLYERNWRFVDQNKLLEHEKNLLQYLTNHYGVGVINACGLIATNAIQCLKRYFSGQRD